MRSRWQRGVGAALAVVVALALWWLQAGGDTDDPPPSRDTKSTATQSQTQTESPQGQTPGPSETGADGLPTIEEWELPEEAHTTLKLIDAGGPFPHDEDGGVFGNREGLLPDRESGYYHEYTVETPGSDDRGARRIVTGSDREYYWTEDHYQSFERILR